MVAGMGGKFLVRIRSDASLVPSMAGREATAHTAESGNWGGVE